MAIISNPVKFDGAQLEAIPGLTVLATDPYKIPRRSLARSVVLFTDRSNTSYTSFTEKNIVVKVGITRSTRAQLETSIDALMTVLQGINKELVLPQGLTVRRYFATLADAPVSKDGGSYIEIDLVFSLDDRYGYDTDYQTLLNNSSVTTSPKTDPIVVQGSAAWQVPTINYTLNSFTGPGNKTISFLNPATSQRLNIDRTWVANDKITIDTSEATVKVNGVDYPFSGAIPKWAPGNGSITVSDTLTSRNYNLLVTYYRRYL